MAAQHTVKAVRTHVSDKSRLKMVRIDYGEHEPTRYRIEGTIHDAHYCCMGLLANAADTLWRSLIAVIAKEHERVHSAE